MWSIGLLSFAISSLFGLIQVFRLSSDMPAPIRPKGRQVILIAAVVCNDDFPIFLEKAEINLLLHSAHQDHGKKLPVDRRGQVNLGIEHRAGWINLLHLLLLSQSANGRAIGLRFG
ncbi:hypothetical protein SS05631_d64780 (plasmid) [Sinorhizobium sp. CCBAU 05631]|nr:hypothetical protein SS05631_d64780 [Sinorhizobium sp. CCBAU 05631]